MAPFRWLATNPLPQKLDKTSSLSYICVFWHLNPRTLIKQNPKDMFAGKWPSVHLLKTPSPLIGRNLPLTNPFLPFPNFPLISPFLHCNFGSLNISKPYKMNSLTLNSLIMKKLTLVPVVLAFFLMAGIANAQNIAISDVSHTADASAVLDVYSTSLGMLVPGYQVHLLLRLMGCFITIQDRIAFITMQVLQALQAGLNYPMETCGQETERIPIYPIRGIMLQLEQLLPDMD